MTKLDSTIPRFRLSLVREAESPYGEDAPSLTSSARLASWLVAEGLCDRPQETMVGLYLDLRHRLIGWTICYQGTLSRATVEPRGILVPGLLLNAASVAIAHNHPSGDPSPSAQDLSFTRRLRRAAELVGLNLVDHLVLGDSDRWVSLRQRGALEG